MSDSDPDFDQALMASAFRVAADVGWERMTVPDAAREAGLSLATARARFPGKRVLLRRFGEQLDRTALAAPSEGSARDRLFDLLMNRFEAMKPHREGIRALVRALPLDPFAALELSCGTRRSMEWMLNAAGLSTKGFQGALRLHGLMAVWTWTARAFEKDKSEDLSATMAVLDKALAQAHEAAGWLSGRREESGDASMSEALAPDAPMGDEPAAPVI